LSVASVADDQRDLRVKLWQVSNGKLLHELQGLGSTHSLAYSLDGKYLAVGGLTSWPKGSIWIYDTSTWEVTLKLDASGQNVLALLFNNDGSQLVSSGTDGKIRLWGSDGKQHKALFYGKQANSIAISPDETLLAANYCNASGTYGCEKGGVVMWRLKDGKIIQQFKDIATAVAFSPDGKIFATGCGQKDPVLRLYSVEGWKLLATLPGNAESLVFSPDGKMITITDFQTIKLFGVR
jgi:WD40 repeat protein